MKLTYGDLKKLVEEALKEANVAASAGAYQTPKAFTPKKNKNTIIKK